jgi:hypothetical protein
MSTTTLYIHITHELARIHFALEQFITDYALEHYQEKTPRMMIHYDVFGAAIRDTMEGMSTDIITDTTPPDIITFTETEDRVGGADGL